MEYLIINLKHRIIWSISPNALFEEIYDDPPIISFVNPLVLLHPENSFLTSSCSNKPFIFGFVGDRLIFHSDFLLFKVEDGISPQILDDIIEKIGIFLSKIRHISKQWDIAESGDAILMSQILKKIKISRLAFPQRKEISRGILMGRFVDSAVTWENVKQCCEMSKQWKPFLYDTILLDAIKAMYESDYRKSILYFAIAIEKKKVPGENIFQFSSKKIQSQSCKSSIFITIIFLSS